MALLRPRASSLLARSPLDVRAQLVVGRGGRAVALVVRAFRDASDNSSRDAAARSSGPSLPLGASVAASASSPALSPPAAAQRWDPKQLVHVLSDEKSNQKLLALAVGQALCSVATLIHDSYIPVYVQDELGLTNTKIGAIQGAAQFLCQLSKGVSGVAGDLLGSQVRVLVFGTLLTFLCKPMFVLMSSVYGVFGVTATLYWFFFAKLMDRMSKGVREAPTKAIMNELARESGDAPDASYGLRQSLATAGMLVGSTVASLTFTLTGRNYVATFAASALFPALALAWMLHSFKDELLGSRPASSKQPATPPPPSSPAPPPPPAPAPTGPASVVYGPLAPAQAPASRLEVVLRPAPAPGSLFSASLSSMELVEVPDAPPPPPPPPPPPLSLWDKGLLLMHAFKPVYWQALAVVAILYFARFDASFLSLRAKQVMDRAALPMLTLVNTLIQVVLTAPLARVSGGSVAARNRLLAVGFLVMIATDACFALPLTANPPGMFLGAALLGVHMAMTHSITVSMVASYMPTGEVSGLGKVSGTAVSFTDLLLGVCLALSNSLAGVLSDATVEAGLGNVGCFAGGAAASGLALAALLLFSRFGGLGNEELVVRKFKKAKAA